MYLLHDVREIIYVGRSVERALGTRLYEHTRDRLKTRWNRFSWFGLRPVSDDGGLGELADEFGSSVLIAALEAVLIEATEPPQNRRRGDGFSGVEFIQAEDPAIGRAQMKAVLEQLQAQMLRGAS